MDSGKEDKAISLKEEGKFVKEWDKLRKFSHVLHRDLGGDQRRMDPRVRQDMDGPKSIAV